MICQNVFEIIEVECVLYECVYNTIVHVMTFCVCMCTMLGRYLFGSTFCAPDQTLGWFPPECVEDNVLQVCVESV